MTEVDKTDANEAAHPQAALSVNAMVVALIVLGCLFFGASLWNYTQTQRYFEPPKFELRAELAQLQGAPVPQDGLAYRDWYSRVLLEELALTRRYQLVSAAVQARVWTRLTGVLTGMVLVFAGSVFLLGRLRADVNFSADIEGAKWALVTSSPGIVFALAGSGLIALAIHLPANVETSDSALYVPILGLAPGGAAAALAPPAPMAPAKAASGGAAKRDLPDAIQRAMEAEAARASAPGRK